MELGATGSKVLLILQGVGSGEGKKDLLDCLFGRPSLAPKKKIQLEVRGRVFESFIPPCCLLRKSKVTFLCPVGFPLLLRDLSLPAGLSFPQGQ